STQDFNFKQYLKEVIEIHLERLNNKSPTSQIKNNTPEKNSAAKRYIRDCKSIDSKKKTFIQLIDQDCSAEEFNKLIEETFGKDFAPDKVKCYIALALFSKNSKYLKNAAQALKDLTDANKFTGNLPFEIAKIYLDLGQINFAYALFQDESLPLRYQKKDYCVGIEGLVIYHIEKVGIDTFSTLLQNGELFNNRSEDKKAAVKVYLAEQYRLGDKYDEALQILDGVLGTGK
ncbi:MAG: hypothetical protein KDK71_05910, partial [Chlamydiia bacterium]|nr:hypothetical protein [Chlamydiia bacterium]